MTICGRTGQGWVCLGGSRYGVEGVKGRKGGHNNTLSNKDKILKNLRSSHWRLRKKKIFFYFYFQNAPTRLKELVNQMSYFLNIQILKHLWSRLGILQNGKNMFLLIRNRELTLKILWVVKPIFKNFALLSYIDNSKKNTWQLLMLSYS